MRARLALPLLAVVAAGASASTAAAAGVPAVSFTTGQRTTVIACDDTRTVTRVDPGAAVSFVVAPARGAAARAARRGSTVTIDRCADGHWTRIATVRLGARTTPLQRSLGDQTAAGGDLRLRVRTRRGGTGRAAYLRVGAGELVDVPVSFKVVNRNRTSIPCLNAPDGKTYTVSGSLVAPRALLATPERAVTLYLHGLGYSGAFFRFQDAPGYDYGAQQAQAGHASVVINRLGNPSGNQLTDGNASCLSSQADMADQVIGRLRAGDYTLGGGAGRAFGKVALAGHSIGGFISEITQYSFKSADALAVISYSDFAIAPLTLSTFFTAAMACQTSPEHADGATGAPNYQAFAKSDADFKAAFLVNMDPAVERIVLAHRNRDPCGDLTNATQALIADQPLARTITSPVLLIAGAQDALFPSATIQAMAQTGFPQSGDVTRVELPQTGHAITLGRTHEQFRAAMDAWLGKHGF